VRRCSTRSTRTTSSATRALDSASAKRALDLLETLRERHGMTVIVVSHDAAVAERADRVIHLIDGCVQDG
jgi:ABC-type lipoprotein export system ATPase subunit